MKPVPFFPFMVPFCPPQYYPYSYPVIPFDFSQRSCQNDWRIRIPSVEDYGVPQANTDQKEHQNRIPKLKEEQNQVLKQLPAKKTRISKEDKVPLKLQKKEKKIQSCGSIEVTQNRNILPNMTSNVLSYIRRINRSGSVVQRIISRTGKTSNFKYSAKKFYSYQFYLKENITDYKGKDAIEVFINGLDPKCSCFSMEEQLFYNKVCRTLIFYYLNQEIFSDVLSSNRVSSRNRKDYLKMKRYIQSLLKSSPTSQNVLDDQ